MAGKILVPVKREERPEELIPYLEEVTKPGMEVVFLVPYPLESWSYLRDHWVTTESTREAMLSGRKIMERYSWETQRGLAEKKVDLAREALRKKGVEVAVDFYGGSLRGKVWNWAANGDINIIMIRAESSHPMMALLRQLCILFGLFQRPSYSPVLLLRPDHGRG